MIHHTLLSLHFWDKSVFCVLIMTKYCSLLRQVVVFCNHISILTQVFVFLGMNHYFNFSPSYVSFLCISFYFLWALWSSSLLNTSFYIVTHYMTSFSFLEKSLWDHWFCSLIWTGSSFDLHSCHLWASYSYHPGVIWSVFTWIPGFLNLIFVLFFCQYLLVFLLGLWQIRKLI